MSLLLLLFWLEIKDKLAHKILKVIDALTNLVLIELDCRLIASVLTLTLATHVNKVVCSFETHPKCHEGT